MDADDVELGHVFGPVLMRMVELLGAQDGPRRFGEAMELAKAELGLNPPPEVEAALLKAAFQIIVSGRLPGCPDA